MYLDALVLFPTYFLQKKETSNESLNTTVKNYWELIFVKNRKLIELNIFFLSGCVGEGVHVLLFQNTITGSRDGFLSHDLAEF